jgi:hypothetical protein
MRAAPNMSFGAKISLWTAALRTSAQPAAVFIFARLLPSFLQHLDGYVILIGWMAVSPPGVPKYKILIIISN